jgi:hypothetical protein
LAQAPEDKSGWSSLNPSVFRLRNKNLCAFSVVLCVSVVDLGRETDDHRGTEFHRGCTEKTKTLFYTVSSPGWIDVN